MTAQINLTQLRNLATRAAGDDECITCREYGNSNQVELGEAVLALIDTAEAAIEMLPDIEDYPPLAHYAIRLRETLNRYTTTQEV